MEIIVTGANGFLGRNILRSLARGKTKVYALTSNVEEMALLYNTSSNITIYEKDALVLSKIPISTNTVLLNCAFPRDSSGELFAEGLKYVFSTIKMAVLKNIGAVINISSQSVYDKYRSYAAKETNSVKPESIYAVGKYATELMIEMVCSDIPFTNVRMASLIGLGFEQRVVNKLIKTAYQTGKINIRESGQKFNFLDVEDAVTGIISIINIPNNEWKTEYNLGALKTYTLSQLAEIIKVDMKNICGREVETLISYEESKDKYNSDLNSERLYRDTEFSPQISMSDSIRNIIKYEISLRDSAHLERE